MHREARAWRRSLVVGLLGLGVASAGVASALAMTAAGAAAGPTASIVSAKRISGGVRVTVRVSVPEKAGGATGKACRKESVTLSAPAAKHGKRVSLHAIPSAVTGGCAATLRGLLPRADYGKAVPFKLTISGPHGTHTTSVRLKILTPPAPSTTAPSATGVPAPAPPAPAPAPMPTTTAPTTTPTTPTTTPTSPIGVGAPTAVNGLWDGHLDPPLSQNVHVAVSDGAITDAYTIQNLLLKCTPPGGGTETSLYFGWSYPHPAPIGIEPSGAFSGTKHKHVDFPSGDYQDLDYTFSGTFAVTTMPYSATFSLGISGTIVAGGTGYDCNATATGLLGKN